MKPYYFLFILFSLGVKAQKLTVHPAISVGYSYQNRNFGEVGAKFFLLRNDDVIYRLGASAMMGATEGKFAILPKINGDILLNFERNVDFYHAYYFSLGAEATHTYIAPKVGVTLFGLLDINGGYAFPLNDTTPHGTMKGINVNVGLNIPLVVMKN